MAISIPAQSRALPPLDGDHRWWVLKSAARCTKEVETTSKKKLLITTNSNSKSRLASSYSSQLRKSSGTRNARRKKSQQAWFPEGAASGRPILQDPKVKQLSTDSRPCRVPNNRLLRFAGWAASLFCPGEARGNPSGRPAGRVAGRIEILRPAGQLAMILKFTGRVEKILTGSISVRDTLM